MYLGDRFPGAHEALGVCPSTIWDGVHIFNDSTWKAEARAGESGSQSHSATEAMFQKKRLQDITQNNPWLCSWPCELE